MVGIALENTHHGLATYEVVLLLETDAQRGLSDDEAERRLQRFGPNLLPGGEDIRAAGSVHPPVQPSARLRPAERRDGDAGPWRAGGCVRHLRCGAHERGRRIRAGVEGRSRTRRAASDGADQREGAA